VRHLTVPGKFIKQFTFNTRRPRHAASEFNDRVRAFDHSSLAIDIRRLRPFPIKDAAREDSRISDGGVTIIRPGPVRVIPSLWR
jgi:hypothetical protein